MIKIRSAKIGIRKFTAGALQIHSSFRLANAVQVARVKAQNLRAINAKKICALFFLLSTPTIGLAQICGTGSAIAIADGTGSATPGATAIATISVPAFYTSAITDFAFDLQLNHTYVGDLIVTLTSPPPGATTVTIMDRPGSPAMGIFGCSENNINATFDEASGTPVENECPASNPTLSGTLNPEGNLNDFVGVVPAGNWTISVTDNAGQDTGSLIPTGSCLDFTTVPVVLSAFKSKQRGKRLITQWQTASEAFNLGFNVWGNIDGDWRQLNRRIIRSGAVDSVEPLDYHLNFNTNKLPSPPTEVGISSVSSSGFEEFYGPFQIGEKYGELTVPKPIDWAQQREKHAQSMREAGFEMRHGQWRKVNARSEKRDTRLKNRFSDAWLRIEQEGIYRVTYEDLVAQGLDLNRLPIRRLALSHAGKPIARRISGSTLNPRRFGPGADIVFYAQTPRGPLARYTDYTHLRISSDPSLVLNAPYIGDDSDDASVAGTNQISDHHIEKMTFGQPNGYSFIVPGDQPWYDGVIYAFGETGRKQINFTVDEQALLDQPVQINLRLMGGTSFDNLDNDGDGEVEPDHHFAVYLNKAEFPAPIYEGFSEKVDAVHIEATVRDQLRRGNNTVELEVIPDNGHNLDAAYFLSANVEFATRNRASAELNQLRLSRQQEWVSVQNTENHVERAYATDSIGNFSEISFYRHQGSVVFKVPPTMGERHRRTAWLGNAANLLKPKRVFSAPRIDSVSLSLEDIDYVVISDPALIGADLERYTAQQTELGRRVKTVSTHDIFALYSDGLPTPHAIANYLKDAAQGGNGVPPSPFKYVLLVGGHTYNYLGFNVSADERPINLIPSFYRDGKTTINRQIPTAVPFVDFDADGSPDKAIGRWPVRDVDQLKLVVNKTMAWHQQGSHKNNQQALLIAQQNEELHNFSASLERVNANIGHQSNPWLPSKTVFVSDIMADDTIAADQKITEARQRLVDGINQGPALTVYSGHASPTTWGRENLLTTSVVDEFSNNDQPSLIIPLACYTTYYETPKIKSLSERLFADNPAGAVGLSGPALLSYNSDNERFAKHLLRLMTQQGHDLGTATQLAKQAIHGMGERRQALIHNWVTLADPTLSFGLPAIDEVPEADDSPKTAN